MLAIAASNFLDFNIDFPDSPCRIGPFKSLQRICPEREGGANSRDNSAVLVYRREGHRVKNESRFVGQALLPVPHNLGKVNADRSAAADACPTAILIATKSARYQASSQDLSYFPLRFSKPRPGYPSPID
jgi:hypothetical protein